MVLTQGKNYVYFLASVTNLRPITNSTDIKANSTGIQVTSTYMQISMIKKIHKIR